MRGGAREAVAGWGALPRARRRRDGSVQEPAHVDVHPDGRRDLDRGVHVRRAAGRLDRDRRGRGGQVRLQVRAGVHVEVHVGGARGERRDPGLRGEQDPRLAGRLDVDGDRVHPGLQAVAGGHLEAEPAELGRVHVARVDALGAELVAAADVERLDRRDRAGRRAGDAGHVHRRGAGDVHLVETTAGSEGEHGGGGEGSVHPVSVACFPAGPSPRAGRRRGRNGAADVRRGPRLRAPAARTRSTDRPP
ncbi:hypothetical protein Adeh_1784 [Anaeromyxobacter dehalogenans 2CP-C]|uniref:Uncharacterized protein n=1 Tax=Anaeromyxobacter dehalogenans (strain 2CP-C) TaxID=290397 RepID=Q2IIS4_ANADE|nr:hypothetical protein Adeh_1784 [Anaeromyxobacter dehalogenans 2CP-C]